MTVELLQDEALILIAVLTYAEGEARVNNPALVEALKVLRQWRTVLLERYLQDQFMEMYEGEKKA